MPTGMAWADWNQQFFQGRVKSMSGRTREWLGAPDLKQEAA